LTAIALTAGALQAQPVQSVRAAVGRALPILQRSAAEFVAKRACVSCHHNVLPILTLDLARNRGFAVDMKVLQAIEDKTFRALRAANALDDAVQANTLSDPTPNDSYLLIAAHDAGLPPDPTTAVYARRLVRWQRDGHWVTSDFRPPHSNSLFMTTATAIRAIRLYMPDEFRAERDESISAGRQWLFRNRPASTEDATFRLLGLVWSDAAANEIAEAQRDLAAMQKPNGGWPQTAPYASDAYSTGEALFALRQAGVPANDRAWVKGLQFLIASQAKDGTWRVRSRMISPAIVSPPYFNTGFPYAKDEFLSYAGTCWAVMALLSALPESSDQPERLDITAVAAPAWMRTALFGTPGQLEALLSAGLDPNAKTGNGTTVLMAAVLDPEKVQLLLSRGADVKQRAQSGVDALTVAAAYRGTASSVRALLDAGAEVQAPEGISARHSPIGFAAMTGDIDNVKLLIARGARPSEIALSEAVTFGYPDILQTLIAAGADTTITERTGINLLHWATITNRPAVIPILAAARVPINAIDDNGFTPLMYAATIDFGNADVLAALIKAGADRTIRNLEGRTPLVQARRYGHTNLEAALQAK
jgi:ankyrin repeat protein